MAYKNAQYDVVYCKKSYKLVLDNTIIQDFSVFDKKN